MQRPALFTPPAVFQSTLPQGERRICQCRVFGRERISIHAPTRGATSDVAVLTGGTGNFNPRSHKGSDQAGMGPEPRPGISIHAPTRGATYCFYDTARLLYISIHAPTRGATQAAKPVLLRRREFQSTLPQGERLVCGQTKTFGKAISIHAPTRGATGPRIGCRGPRDDFNPRSHKGSDIYIDPGEKRLCISIHAPTRGATR